MSGAQVVTSTLAMPGSFAHDVIRRQLRPLDEKLALLRDQAARGMPMDYPAYRELVGRIAAFTEARDLITAPLGAEGKSLAARPGA